MKISTATSIFSCYALAIGVILIYILSFGTPTYLLRNTTSINCVSSFSTPALPDNNAMVGTLLVKLDIRNKGSFSLSGILEHKPGLTPVNSEKRTILRDINFDYKLNGGGFISINNITIDRPASDKVPNEYFNANVYDFGLPSRTLKIKKIRNAWLFSTTFSPVLMCVTKE